MSQANIMDIFLVAVVSGPLVMLFSIGYISNEGR